jgi:hypothetical protein
MGNNRGDLPAGSGLISGCTEGCQCYVCHTVAEVAELTGTVTDPLDDNAGIGVNFHLCTRCAAILIERVSGFRMPRVLDQMYTARDTARNIRLVDQ